MPSCSWNSVVIGTVPPSRVTAGVPPFSRRSTALAAARNGWSEASVKARVPPGR